MSDIRGPTSALTSFLRDKNIRIPNANRFRRRDEAAAAATAAAAEAASGGVTQTTQDTLNGAVAALQAEASREAGPSASSSSSSPATGTSRSAKRKAPVASGSAAPAKKGKAVKGLSMNFDEEDEDDDEEYVGTGSEADDGGDADEHYVPRATRRRGGDGAAPAAEVEEEISKWSAIQQGVEGGPSRKLTATGAVDNCAGCSRKFSLTGYT